MKNQYVIAGRRTEQDQEAYFLRLVGSVYNSRREFTKQIDKAWKTESERHAELMCSRHGGRVCSLDEAQRLPGQQLSFC